MELCRRRHNSKERRLEPQITLGLLTDATGFPLTVEAFEGNKAETATMLPVINAFKAAHQLTDVTVVADAGMISEANQIALQAAGLSFILGTRIPHLPDVVREWRDKHPDEEIPDGLVLTQPWPATSSEKARGIPDRVIYYQYRHDRARRTLRGIDEQVAKAERAVDGNAPVKRNRFIQLTGATKIGQPRSGGQGPRAGRVEGLHHQPHQPDPGVRHRRLPPAVAHREELPHVQARPAGPTDLPPQTRIDRGPPDASCSPPWPSATGSRHQTGWSIKKFVRTARRYRTVQIKAGTTDPHRRRPATRRPPRSHRQNQHRPCALNCPKTSGR